MGAVTHEELAAMTDQENCWPMNASITATPA
jgi:hypothetical protein